jgi:methylated-DNA-[protein]-cysteine S-methyltransferase
MHLLGTPFQRAVWQAVLEIPYGETRSYADIARSIGHPLASRAVGAANAVNPLPFVVPCHRVIGADGTIKGFPGGRVTRAMLLQLEAGRTARG